MKISAFLLQKPVFYHSDKTMPKKSEKENEESGGEKETGIPEIFKLPTLEIHVG